MMKFNINYEYMKVGTIIVEANNEKEALSLVENMEIDNELSGEYLTGSFKANVDTYEHDFESVPFHLLRKINKGQHEGEISDEAVLEHIEYQEREIYVHDHDRSVEVELWTDAGVNRVFTLNKSKNVDFFSQLMEYVETFDIDYEIDLLRRNDENYKNDFTLQEALDDFNAYRDTLSQLLMHVFVRSVRSSVISWLEVNRDNGFFDDEPEGKKDNYNNINDSDVFFYFFEWMWSERENENIK